MIVRAWICLSLIICFFGFGSAQGATFSYADHFEGHPEVTLFKTFRIDGPIERGDFEKLLQFMHSIPPQFFIGLGSMQISSQGGDLGESIRIANFLKPMRPYLKVDQRCWSSCLLIFLSAVVREAKPGEVGIHHPYFDSTYFGKLRIEEAERIYKEQLATFKAFVLEQGLPQSLYELLMATNSQELYFLNQHDLDLIGVYPPYFEEAILARCGTLGTLQMSTNPVESEKWIACVHSITVPGTKAAIRALLSPQDQAHWDHDMLNVH